MKGDEMEKGLPQRKRLRIKNYDYSQCGFYYITVCTHNKQNLFGEIENNMIKLNHVGKIVAFTLNDLPNHNNINLHQYIIMPNHIHAIIEIPNRRERSVTVLQIESATIKESRNFHGGIPEIIRQFKTFSSKRINSISDIQNNIRSQQKIWQKSYYEHIIRNQEEYIRITKYIIENPVKWQSDKLHSDLHTHNGIL